MSKKPGRNDPCPCGSGKKYKHCCLDKNRGEAVPPAMPQRPREHELDTEAIRYIQSQLPSGWPCEEVKHDYGKDLRVEVFQNGAATAMEFLIQAKGHEKFDIVNSNEIAQPLSVATLNYFSASPLPVLLVAYSAQEKRASYLWVKPYIAEVLNKQKPGWQNRPGGSEITLHIPMANHLDPSAHPSIFDHVDTEHAKLQMQRVTLPPSTAPSWPGASRHFASPRVLAPKITQYLHRRRLVDQLATNLQRGSVFVHTDAGYGKTWLVKDTVDFVKPAVCVWYTFDGATVPPTQFVGEVASEISRQTNLRLRTLAYLSELGKEAALDEVVPMFIEDVQSLNQEMWLVLEDIHALTDPGTALAVQGLLAARPTNLKLILTSRHPLPFGEAKLISQGLVTVIERGDVAFRPEETQEYLEKILQVSMTPEQVDYLQQRTDGWIAAIGLAGNALQGTSAEFVTSLFARLTGYKGNIYNFFAEEVYGGFDPGTKHLLRRLGIVEDITPEIVNLFTGETDGGQVVKDLARRNMFLLEADAPGSSYHFHSLFAEFLQTRFRDEEGGAQVREAHQVLARYYQRIKDWVTLFDHAIGARDYALAVESLERTGPVGANAGFGYVVLESLEKIPPEWLEKSAALLEVNARCAFQVGELQKARAAASRAYALYRSQNDAAALDRAEFLLAEIRSAAREISPEAFVKTARGIVASSYKRNETFFAAQVELRMIEVGQTLTIEHTELLQDLVKRCARLVARLEKLGSQYSDLRARALSVQAHLTFEVVTFQMQNGLGKVKVRESVDKPVPLAERMVLARQAIDGWERVSNLYAQAERLISPRNEIERALIRLNRVADYMHHDAMLELANAGGKPFLTAELEEKKKQIRYSYLAVLEECAQVFSKYHVTAALASCFCDAADLYDVLGDMENRDQLAREALEIASAKGLVSIANRAERVLAGKLTYSSVRKEMENAQPSDRAFANMTDEDKKSYVNSFVKAFAGDANTEQMRKAVESGVDDMVAGAKKRLSWCQHMQLVEDLRHTQSMATFYQRIPSKVITCELLGFRSPRPGYSFERLWPEFEAFYCLGCLYRSLAK